jgi:cytochrome c oxidase subunit III
MTLAHQFDDAAQQRHAATLGMWTFLATEILFFGGLFVTYALYRHAYPSAWQFGSRHLKEYLGGTNTTVLLTSSLTAALAVHFVRLQRRNAAMIALGVTLALGLCFLLIKAREYSLEYDEHLIPAINFYLPAGTPADIPHVELFMIFYFIMTLLHAAHMVVGISLLTFLIVQLARRRYLTPGENFNAVEMIVLYWHFVDLVWIFLFPLLYLVR